jgi:hypothetical protein
VKSRREEEEHYIDIAVETIDGRNGVEEMRRKRNVAREKVESRNECFGVLLFLFFLFFH